MHRKLFVLICFASLTACTVEPKAIIYGEDKCDYCLMTIVDAKFAAEAVTEKGKVFKFDAIECLAKYLNKEEQTPYAYLQVSNYQAPAKMLDARNSYYLYSKSIPSPMGGFLSAYQDERAASSQKAHKGGELMDWQALQRYVSNKR